MGTAPTRAGAPSYLRVATSARMLLLLLLLLGAAAVCVRLGMWQLDRAEVRGAAADREAAGEGAVRPAALTDVVAPQTSLSGDHEGRLVEVTGTFDASDELLVVDRLLDERTGYLVLTPLRVTAADGAVLPVVRGWVPDAEEAERLAPAPTGQVTVTGYLRSGEQAGRTGLPEGQVSTISPAELVNRWGGPIYSAYVVIAEVDPPQDAALAVLPPPTAETGLDLRNVAYALQWWIFGGFALLLWFRLVRDEVRAASEEAGEFEASDPVSPGRTVTGAGAGT
jgi:cytochrome oxidase assembly protein ShyY1